MLLDCKIRTFEIFSVQWGTCRIHVHIHVCLNNCGYCHSETFHRNKRSVGVDEFTLCCSYDISLHMLCVLTQTACRQYRDSWYDYCHVPHLAIKRIVTTTAHMCVCIQHWSVCSLKVEAEYVHFKLQGHQSTKLNPKPSIDEQAQNENEKLAQE